MPKAFERAIYGETRKGKEQLSEYIIRVEAAFARLQEEGVKLPTEVKGYVMFRQAALTSVQEDQVTTWTSGKYDRETVVAALRKLEKVQKEKGGRNYLVDGHEGTNDRARGHVLGRRG